MRVLAFVLVLLLGIGAAQAQPFNPGGGGSGGCSSNPCAVSAASGTYVSGALVDIYNGTFAPWDGLTTPTGTPTLMNGIAALYESSLLPAKIEGNAGGVMDFAGQNATSPANALQIGGQFNTTPTTITSGHSSPLQLDAAGNLLVNTSGVATKVTGTVAPGGSVTSVPPVVSGVNTPNGIEAVAGDSANNIFAMPGLNYTTGPVWTPSTAQNTTVTIENLSGAPEILIEFDTSTCTTPAGVITGQVSYNGGASFFNFASSQVRVPTNGAPAGSTLNFATVGASSQTPWLVDTKSAPLVQLKLTTAITGTGTCSISIFYTLVPVVLNPLGVASSTVVPTEQTYIQTMSQYPVSGGGAGTAPVAAKGSGSTGAVTATLAATASVTNYLCHLDATAAGGTATFGPITVTGISGGTWTYQVPVIPNAVPFQINISPCVPASGTNTAIVATTTADATATAVDVNISGYQQ